MKYEAVRIARFIYRENRFVATCQIEDQIVQVHVKNTGRCKELLIPEVDVALNFNGKLGRKTNYDLVAVKKGQHWINIDSQIPNKLVDQGLKNGAIKLPGIMGELTKVKREEKFGQSKLDFYLETSKQEKIFLEVKGMTLESQGIGAFPDAPSLRALKHVKELQEAVSKGYRSFIVFVAQGEQIKEGTINESMQPALQDAIQVALEMGVHVLVYNCLVDCDSIVLYRKIPFYLQKKFKNLT